MEDRKPIVLAHLAYIVVTSVSQDTTGEHFCLWIKEMHQVFWDKILELEWGPMVVIQIAPQHACNNQIQENQ